MARTKQSYLDKIPKSSHGILVQERAAVQNFEEFCQFKYHVSSDKIIEELKKMPASKQESHIYEMLQNFGNYMIEDQSISILTSKRYVKRIKNYLNYLLEIKIHNEDLKQNTRWPKEVQRDDYPLEPQEARKILAEAKNRKTMYLFQMGTGIPIGEAMQLRKRDFNFGLERIKVVVPGKYRKVRAVKRTFVPKWIESEIKELLGMKKDDDMAFNDNPNINTATTNEANFFNRVRQRAKLDHLVYDSGVAKITIHSFRSWFITRANKVDFGLGNALAGQGYYMKRYSRYSEKEMMDFFIKAEEALSPFEPTETQSQKEMKAKIAELEVKNILLGDFEKRIRLLEQTRPKTE